MSGERRSSHISSRATPTRDFASGEAVSELVQSSHGFSALVHGFATKSKTLTHEIPPATQATVTFDIFFYKKKTEKFRPERDSNRLWLLTGTNDLCDIPVQYIPSYHSPQLKYMEFHIFAFILRLLRVYLKLTKWQAYKWFDSSVVRALHQYRRGHGIESSTGMNFI